MRKPTHNTQKPMEIDITTLSEVNAFNLSHSVAEGGENAGRNTWENSKAEAGRHPVLDTPEKLQAMRDYARSFGAWSEDEIKGWSDTELNALLLQMIAGDCRELGADSLAEIDWEEAEELQSAGQAASNLFRGDDGKIYFYLGN
jgi:hypothetical protein